MSDNYYDDDIPEDNDNDNVDDNDDEDDMSFEEMIVDNENDNNDNDNEDNENENENDNDNDNDNDNENENELELDQDVSELDIEEGVPQKKKGKKGNDQPVIPEFDVFWDDADGNLKKKKSSFAEMIVPPSERRTKPFLTKYEFTKLIGIRSEQIINGSMVMLSTDEIDNIRKNNNGRVSCIDIAYQELWKRRIPFILRRKTYDRSGTILNEDWKIDEFMNIDDMCEYHIV
jgi:hypothetical protein